MHLQPHSRSIRKHIEVKSYFALFRESQRKSYIGTSLGIWSEKMLLRRLDELVGLEKSGFVFEGEKNWIQTFLANDRSVDYESYDKWVNHNIINELGITFKRINKSDNSWENYSTDQYWILKINLEYHLLNHVNIEYPSFKNLADRNYNLRGEVECAVPDIDEAPSAMHVCVLFAALHNLEYTLATFPKKHKDLMQLDGLDVTNMINPLRYLANVSSVYSDWDETIINGEAWIA